MLDALRLPPVLPRQSEASSGLRGATVPPPTQAEATRATDRSEIEVRAAVEPAKTARTVVAGASIAGLGTALALAKLGEQVVVLEARGDPRTLAGREALTRGEAALARANAALQAGDQDTAGQAFSEAQRAFSTLWGQRHRTTVLDQFSLDYLRSHGVDTSGFSPLVSATLAFGKGQPTARLRAGTRTAKEGNGRLDAATMLAQRDVTVQVTIREIEARLLEAAERHPNIQVRFDAPVSRADEHDTGVTVRCGDGPDAAVSGDILVVADGGGRRSVSHALGVQRSEFARETLSWSVFEHVPGETIEHLAQDGASGAYLLDDDGTWQVVGYDGKGTVTVGKKLAPGEPEDQAYHLARKLGVKGPLREKPSHFDSPLDRADQFVVGRRTLFVGDAAIRGTPLMGIGAQFALLGAQNVVDLKMLGMGEDAGITPEGKAWYEAQQRKNADMFHAVELAFVELNGGESGSTVQAAAQAFLEKGDLLAALDELDVRFVADPTHRNRGTLDLCLAFDGAVVGQQMPSGGLRRFAESLGRMSLTGLVDLDFQPNRTEIHLSAHQPLVFSTALETVQLVEGRLVLERRNESVHARLEGARLLRERKVSHNHTDTTLDAEVQLPDAFVIGMLERIAPQVALSGSVGRGQPIAAAARLKPGTWSVGPARLRSDDDAVCRARFTPGRHGTPAELTVDIRGGLRLENLAELTALLPRRNLGGELLRWGRRASRGVLDVLLDRGGQAASVVVDRIQIDAAGEVTFARRLPLGKHVPLLSFKVSEEMAAALRDGFADTAGFYEMLRQALGTLREATITRRHRPPSPLDARGPHRA